MYNVPEYAGKKTNWISHPNLQEQPKFNLKVVQSFQEALSREIGEAVSIDLRAGNVLYSKSEYNRCKLPRLTINMEDWNAKKDELSKPEAGSQESVDA